MWETETPAKNMGLQLNSLVAVIDNVNECRCLMRRAGKHHVSKNYFGNCREMCVPSLGFWLGKEVGGQLMVGFSN